jgi:isocitrate dehydrogenase
MIETDAVLLLEDASRFDVVVTPNMHGNLLSLAVARSAAPIGCAHYVHLGTDFSMFETAHDLTQTSVEKDTANPSGLLLASVMLLRIGQLGAAELIHNAWLRTIEDGINTADMSSSHVRSRRIVGTATFANCVIENLGEIPSFLRAARYKDNLLRALAHEAVPRPTSLARKTLVGVDVFVHWRGIQPRALAETMRCAQDGHLELTMITSRDVKVWPGPVSNILRTDHWRCRYRARPGNPLSHADIADLQSRLAYLGIDFIKTDHLYEFDGDPGLVNEPAGYQA